MQRTPIVGPIMARREERATPEDFLKSKRSSQMANVAKKRIRPTLAALRVACNWPGYSIVKSEYGDYDIIYRGYLMGWYKGGDQQIRLCGGGSYHHIDATATLLARLRWAMSDRAKKKLRNIHHNA